MTSYTRNLTDPFVRLRSYARQNREVAVAASVQVPLRAPIKVSLGLLLELAYSPDRRGALHLHGSDQVQS
jgi:hypothetical protein